MTTQRIAAAILSLGLLFVPGHVRAADYPVRPITIIIPAPPGGAFDIYTRLLMPGMEKALGNGAKFVPQNVAAGAAARGATQLYKAKPDGYTIGIFNMPGALLLPLMGPVDFQIEKFTWLAGVGHELYAMVVAGNSPINSVADLKALGRPIKFTGLGAGSTAYAATQIAIQLLHLNAEIIAGYRGAADYIVAVVRGDGDATIANMTALTSYVQAKQVKMILSFDSGNTIPNVPNAPAVDAPDLAKLTLDVLWGAPPGVPADISKRLMDAIMKAATDPETEKNAKAAGVTLVVGDAAHATAIVQDELAFYTKNKEYVGKP